jgi:hypothetical protein
MTHSASARSSDGQTHAFPAVSVRGVAGPGHLRPFSGAILIDAESRLGPRHRGALRRKTRFALGRWLLGRAPSVAAIFSRIS